MKTKLPALPPVKDLPLAPHRYLWNRDNPVELERTYKEAVAAAPYQKGDVVLTVYDGGSARAIVVAVFAERNADGDFREYYHVRRETKAGHWAQRVYTIHPGYIQRGYQRAGLAPEIPQGALECVRSPVELLARSPAEVLRDLDRLKGGQLAAQPACPILKG
jgi:hypothetical protein